MLKGMTLASVLESFRLFWETHFPEQNRMTRSEALITVKDKQRGSLNTAANDAEMAGYQDGVASVYGAYEGAEFQLATMQRVLRVVQPLPESAHIVSLGCGPGSYELWLLSQTAHRVTLVDHSPKMLKRAREIATAIGVADRITTICSDARNVPAIPSGSVDIVLSINAMHWSAHWREWIAEAHRICRPGSAVLITFTPFLPRSNIKPEEVGVAFRCHFIYEEGGLLVPPSPADGGMVAMHFRSFLIGRKVDPAQKKKEKKRRQREQKRR